MDNFENRTPDQQPEEKEVRREAPQAPKVEQKKYYTDSSYYGQQQYNGPQYGAPQYANMPRQSGFPTWAKVLLIIALVVLLIVFMFTSCIRSLTNNMNGMVDSSFTASSEGTLISDVMGEYIAVLHIEDQISQSSSFWYDHYYLLDTIADLITDDDEGLFPRRPRTGRDL